MNKILSISLFNFKNLKVNIVSKLLFLKHCSRFLFLHKPLCDKYKNESFLFLNKIYICRSCFYLYMGALIAVAFSFICNINTHILLFGSIAVILFSHPKIYKYALRVQRDYLRFLAGFLLCLLCINVFKINIYLFIGLITILYSVKAMYGSYRKKIDLCSNCKELNYKRVCQGFKEQHVALLKLENDLSEYITLHKEKHYA